MILLMLAFLCDATVSVGWRPAADDRRLIDLPVQVSLHTLDATLYERASIGLRVSFRNLTDSKLTLFPVLKPIYGKDVRLYYRQVPDDFKLMRYTREWDTEPGRDPDGVLLQMPANGEDSFRFSLAADASRGTFIFDRPGDYELKAIYDAAWDSYAALETAPLQLRIDPAPPTESDALADWDVDLAIFAQDDGGMGGPHFRREVTRALRFIDKHPLSLYSRLLRQRTLDTLALLRRKGIPLTEYEQDAFERLKRVVREEAQRDAASR